MHIGGGNSSQSQGTGATTAHTVAGSASSNIEAGQPGPGLGAPNRSHANLDPAVTNITTTSSTTTTFAATNTGSGQAGAGLGGRMPAAPAWRDAGGLNEPFTVEYRRQQGAGTSLADPVLNPRVPEPILRLEPDVPAPKAPGKPAKARGPRRGNLEVKIQGSSTSASRSADSELVKAQARELFRQGKRHAGSGEGRARAIDCYLRAARLGHAKAQYQLGLYCLDGRGGEEMEEGKACEWFGMAGAKQHVGAQLILGHCFAIGRGGVEVDQRQARLWWRQAARQGNVEAQLQLANNYQLCSPLPDNMRKAAKWLGRGADSGDAAAMQRYGAVLAKGEGIDQDDFAALDWFRRAAAKGNAEAMFWLGIFHEAGRGGLLQDANFALACYEQAARQRHPGAQFARGYMLWHGVGTVRNLPKSVRAYMKAAMAGVAEAQWRLGICSEHGLVVGQDTQAAARLIRMAADNDDPDAQFHLARCYYRGIGLQKDRNSAVDWLARSSIYAPQIVRDSGGGIDYARTLPLLHDEVEAYEERMMALLDSGQLNYRKGAEPENRSATEAQEGVDPADPQDSSDSTDSGDSPDSTDSQGATVTGRLRRIQELSEPPSPGSTDSSTSDDIQHELDPEPFHHQDGVEGPGQSYG